MKRCSSTGPTSVASTSATFQRNGSVGSNKPTRRQWSRCARSTAPRGGGAIDCADYAALICKPASQRGTSAAFKTAARQQLARGGRAIIANIGDQQSDLVGGLAERTFKLPNPFYLTE